MLMPLRYPAGYWGFDAAEYAHGDRTAAWPGLDRGAIEERLTEIVNAHPSGAWVAFGVDANGESQEAWNWFDSAKVEVIL